MSDLKQILAFTVAVSFALLLAGCGGGDNNELLSEVVYELN